MHLGRAAGHNGILTELYKYSKWARHRLRNILKLIWETAVIPRGLVTGVATPVFKSGNQEVYSRYRIIVVFIAEYKIFACMFLKRTSTECSGYLKP